MIQHDTQVRVRYADTDQMGVVYHGKYVEYFEVSRAEMIRHFGYSYADMEAEGVMMPVTELRARYLRPARYDQLLTLRAILREWPGKRIVIETQILNEEGKLLVEGFVTLAFWDVKSGKTVTAPDSFLKLFEAHWQD